MKSVCINQYGDPNTLKSTESDKPVPAANEVLIQVKAVGVNPLDLKVRAGYLKDLMPKVMPAILGWEFAGIVAQVGTQVADFKVGDEVFGLLPGSDTGAYAEFVIAPASIVAKKPASVDFATAGAIAMVATTAYTLINKEAKVHAGQHVLIHGAGGSVGSFAVQMAKAAGASFVIANGSGVDRDRVMALGADQFIAFQEQKFDEMGPKADVIIDTVGGDTLARSYGAIKPGGMLLTTVMPVDEQKAKAAGINARFVFTQPDAQALAAIAAQLDSGELKAQPVDVMPLADAAKAHEAMENRTAKRKIVLQP